MAVSTPAVANKSQIWQRQFWKEYTRENQFSFCMGKSPTSVIHMNSDLGVGAGHQITIPLVTRLSNAPVRGSSILEGNEESLGNYGHKVGVELVRNGVEVRKQSQVESAFDMPQAARDMLQAWIKDNLRDDLITSLQSPVISVAGETVSVKYSSASEAQKDAWLTANPDRILFGTAVSNATAGDHSVSLAAVTASMKMSSNVVSLAKRIAKNASPKIRPFKLKNGRDCFVMFMDSFQYRDFIADATVQGSLQQAMMRSEENPLFSDSLFYWNGVLVVEVEEMPSIGTVGAAAAKVGCAVLCGAQALGVAWGQLPQPKTQPNDYESRQGFAIEEIRGVNKMFFNNKQHGCVSVYTASAGDTV